MKQAGVILLLLLLSPFIAGSYGILNDQLSYSVSPEYYTKFKFQQFGFIQAIWSDVFEHPRVGALAVGWFATWWMGPPIALVIGLAALIHHKASKMFRIGLKSIGIALLATFVLGLTGLAYGYFILAQEGVSWRLPPDLVETRDFIAVGSMHNFSYAGGVIGLLLAVAYIVISKRRNNERLKR